MLSNTITLQANANVYSIASPTKPTNQKNTSGKQLVNKTINSQSSLKNNVPRPHCVRSLNRYKRLTTRMVQSARDVEDCTTIEFVLNNLVFLRRK